MWTFNQGLREGAALPPLARILPDRQGRVRRRAGVARPVRNPAGLEPAPTHTHPLSASANECHRGPSTLLQLKDGCAWDAAWRGTYRTKEMNHDAPTGQVDDREGLVKRDIDRLAFHTASASLS